jgi:hypothetical protein
MPDDDSTRRPGLKPSREWTTPKQVYLLGPGPFELPPCGTSVAVQTDLEDCFVLELQTLAEGQRVRVPIANETLPILKMIIGNMELRQTP